MGGRANKANDNAVRDIFFENGDDEDEEARRVGCPVPFNLNPDKGEFTFHSANGCHTSIDHIFTDPVSIAYTRGGEGVPPFLGSRTGEHDAYTPFDHRVLVAIIMEGQEESLGRQRPKAERLRGTPKEIKEYLARLPTHANLENDDDVAL